MKDSFLFLLTVSFATLHQISNGQIHLPTEIDKNENKELTQKDWEMLKQLSSHPQFIYSEFMESSLNSARKENVSAECISDTQQVITDFLLGRRYSRRILDSMGKLGSGILDGNFQWLGSFEQCKSATEDLIIEVPFNTQYCLVPMVFTIGLCVPDSCVENDVEIMINTFFIDFANGSDIITGDVHCVEPVPWRTGDTAMVVVTALFGLLVILSTGYELYKKSQADTTPAPSKMVHDNLTKNGVELNSIKTISNGSLEMNGKASQEINETTDQKMNGSTTILVQQSNQDLTGQQKSQDTKTQIFQSFSFISNTMKLVNMTSTPKGMECLNGIRVLSMAWVILGHTYAFVGAFTSNIITLLQVTQELTFQFILEAEVSVDTFFFLSGFLVAFGTLKLLHKTKGRMNWGLFYIHRYLRLTPVYAFVLFFWITVVVHFITGPFESMEKQNSILFIDNCYKYWWTNLLYINTVYPTSIYDSCMGWTWYLSHDMIFYIVSPIFVYALYRKRPVGYILLLLGILSNMLAVGIVYNKYGLSDPTVTSEEKDTFAWHIYFRPYFRHAPYLVGLGCADIYMWTKDKVKNKKDAWWKIFVVVMWAVAIALNLAILYGIHPYNIDNSGFIEPVWLNDLFAATFKTVWGLVLAWITYACLTGWGGFINTLLSLKIWEPLVRLCYLAYLLHPIVIYTFYMNMQQTIMVNHWIMGYLFVAFLGVTFALSVAFFLLVEQPFNRLERLLLKK